MEVTLVGMGCGPAGCTAEGRTALLEADLVLGAPRLLEALPEGCTARRIASSRPGEVRAALEAAEAERPCAVFSGDTGFYSGAGTVSQALREAGWQVRLLPGISSVQMLAARLDRPWQDWRLCSAHAGDCDAVAAVLEGRPAFFLTGGARTPGALCAQLARAGLGELTVTVGERLGYPDERVVSVPAAEAAGQSFAPLSVLLAEAAPSQPRRTPGLPDDAFLRDKVPMTKQEVRAAALGKLAVRPEDTVWDVGAGTGSVSVELALAARRVYAVERSPEACGLVRRNRARFGAWNLTVVEGPAPEMLAGLPAPDAVFIGGSGGALGKIVAAALEKNPRARICISAIALETLSAAAAALTAAGLSAEVCQIAVSRTRPAGRLHLLTAANPVFLITARREGDGT